MKILSLEGYASSAIARLRGESKLDVSENINDLASAEILLIRSKTQINKDFLEKAPKLKLIISATSGFDHMDWKAAKERGVICAHTPDANALSTAELTMGLMINLERDIPLALKNTRMNQWRNGLKRTQGLEGKTLGIVGLGRVGSHVARMAKPFGVKLVGHDPYIELEKFHELGVERHGFTELLRISDIVTFHVPLTKETHYFMTTATFNEMLTDAVLINTCRGAVVDQNELLLALDEGTIRGAAMDVIEREPPPHGHKVLRHPRLMLTPHVGAYTENAWEKSSQAAVEQALNFIRGEKVLNTLPLDTRWFHKT